MSKRLFGTDGIRGRVLEHPITADYMFRIGEACGDLFRGASVVVGNDTRASCCMLQIPLIAGMLSRGVNVRVLGCVPSPAVSALLVQCGASCGVMISSSHNPSDTNGIKFFDSCGFKFSAELELEIERLLLEGRAETERPLGLSAVPMVRMEHIYGAANAYMDHVKQTLLDSSLVGTKVVIDCANGAMSDIAGVLLEDLGAEVSLINSVPNGSNINHECGALHPEQMCKKVKEIGAHMGMAFDGDGDRLVACDEQGKIIDGDILIAYLAMNMHAIGYNQGVVFTKISNMGLAKFFDTRDIRYFISDVGERRVVDAMIKMGAAIGGEKSGHIIIGRDNNLKTSDGLRAALHLLYFLRQSGKSISEQLDIVDLYPQVFANVQRNKRKKLADILTCCQNNISDIERGLGDGGRVLIRESGTEDLIRLMVECKDLPAAELAMGALVEIIDGYMQL